MTGVQTCALPISGGNSGGGGSSKPSGGSGNSGSSGGQWVMDPDGTWHKK